MIVSASYRTDIPAFYPRWFARRLRAGMALYRNPYAGTRHRVDLRPGAVSGWVFWTRNIRPFEDALDAIAARGEPFYVQYSLTAAPAWLETATPPTDHALAAIRALAARFGPRAVVWRYDPIVMTKTLTPAWHANNFARLAAALAGACDEVTVNFMTLYAKTRRNLDRAGIAWRDPDAGEKAALTRQLAEIAAAHGLRLTLCSQPDLPAPAAACIDAARLADHAADAQLLPRRRARTARPGCLCAPARDIGAYESCPHGCLYCYAVRDPARARRHPASVTATAESLS